MPKMLCRAVLRTHVNAQYHSPHAHTKHKETTEEKNVNILIIQTLKGDVVHLNGDSHSV